MKFDWKNHINKTLNVTMQENYGVKYNEKNDNPFYEIVFKTGRLTGAFDEGLLLEAVRETQKVLIYIPYSSIKCVEIFDVVL